MRKFFKKRSNQILSVFVLLPFLAQTFVTPLFALDEIIPELQVEEAISETQVDIPIDTSEDILEEGISDPEEIAKPIWVTSGESATTFSPVVLGETYVYPNNFDVTVVFSSLPEVSGTLTIKTVYLTDEQVKVTNAASNIAYDITTDMVDGTFNYDLTLPKVGESNRVVYAESVNELVDAKDISNVIENESSLKIEDLDHFTVFVVVNPNPAGNGNTCTVASITGTCYDTIQQAINMAVDGDTINVTNGTYTQSLSIDKRINLIGAGSSVTTIKPNIVGGAVITVNAVTDPMTIEGFTIDALDYTNESGIYIQNGSSAITVKDNNIINFTDKGVLISNSNDNVVKDNTIEGSSIGSFAGVYLDNQAGNNTIDYNAITLATSGIGHLYDIWFTGTNAKDNIVINNTINGGLRAFQQDIGVSGTTTFSGNNVGNTTSPIFAGVYLNGGNAIISGNTLKDTVRPIEFWGVGDISILGNTIDGSTYDGINAGSFSSVVVTNNAFQNIGFNALNNQMAGKVIDARNNKWGSSKPSIILSMINGNVTYDPWYGKTVTQEVTVNEYEKGGIYYVKLNDTLNFNISGEPVYKQHYITGLWGYNSSTGNRTNDRYIGWVNINPSSNDFVNVDKGWSMVTDHWMGSDAPGTIIPAGDYLLWAERYYDEGGYVQGSTTTKRVTIDNTRPVLSVLTPTTNERISGPVNISIAASDSQTDISSVSMHIYKVIEGSDDILVSGCTSIPTTFNGTNWNATINNGGHCSLVEGTYEIAAWAYDGVKNPGWASRVQFTIDQTPPFVPLNGTPNDTVIPTNEFNFTWDASTDTSAITYEFQSSLNPAQSGGVLTSGLWESGTLSSNIIHSSGAQDGIWYWQVRAKDAAGNYSNWSDIWNVTLDTQAPSKPENLYFRDIDNNQDIQCDGYSNTKHISEYWDASVDTNLDHYEYSSYNAPDGSAGLVSKVLYTNSYDTNWWEIPSEGIYGFQVRAVDKAGNKSDWALINATGIENSCQIHIDWVKPTVDLVFATPGPDAKGFQAIFTEDVRQADAENSANYFLFNYPMYSASSGDLSGDATIFYDSSTHTATVTFTKGGWYISPEQEWGVKDIHDLAGNILSINPYKERSTPMADPITSVLGIDSDWHSKDVTVTLVCEDIDGSGCYKTHYSLDNGVTYNKGNTVIVSTEGENKITFYSEDKAGNKETPKVSDAVKIDKTFPVITISAYNTDWTNQDIVVNASTDEGTLNADSHTFTENGTFEFVATDNAGNITTQTVTITNIDKISPTINSMVISDGLLTVTSTDTLSDVKSVEVQINGGTWTPYTSGMNLYALVSDVPGTYPVSIRVTDNANNTTTDNTSFTIPQGQVLGATTGPTPKTSPTYYYAQTTNIGESEDENTTDEEEMIIETTEDEKVLGETTCEATYKISGTIYYDKNDNGKYDEEEKIVEGIEVKIYNRDKELEKTVTTDEKGHWEATLCPGEYTTQVERAEDQTIVLGESDTTLDISVEKKTNWWLIVVGGVVVLILLKVLVDRSKKKEEI